MMNKKIYYRGDPQKGAAIIAALEALGGINTYLLEGNDPKYIYFIAPVSNEICSTDKFSVTYKIIEENYTELFPGNIKDVYFKLGDKVKFLNNNNTWLVGTLIGVITISKKQCFSIINNANTLNGFVFVTEAIRPFDYNTSLKESEVINIIVK